MCRYISLSLLVAAMLSTASSAAVVWQDDFTSFQSELYDIQRAAQWDEAAQRFILTPVAASTSGRIFRLNRCLMDIWDAEFDYWVGGGNGADGFTFAFCRNYDYPWMCGSQLDFWVGAEGYAIEFDEFSNGWGLVIDPTMDHHVALVRDSAADHLRWASVDTIDDAQWHHARIEFRSGAVSVWVDGSVVLAHEIPGYTPFWGYFGFTAATGSLHNRQAIDNVLVTWGGEVSTQPSTWGSIKSLYR